MEIRNLSVKWSKCSQSTLLMNEGYIYKYAREGGGEAMYERRRGRSSVKEKEGEKQCTREGGEEAVYDNYVISS